MGLDKRATSCYGEGAGEGGRPLMQSAWRFGGREVGPEQVAVIREVVESGSGLSRTGLAQTVCELLDWKRPRGSLKGRECGEFLEELEAAGVLRLPDKRVGRPLGSRTRVPVTELGEPGPPLMGTVADLAPLMLEEVRRPEERLRVRELIGRHHYLGYAVPFGAQLSYLAYATRPERTLVGCVQFSSPAWRMAVRDRWIGWDDATRAGNLQQVVNNSRFLILPWVRVKNLASAVLSVAARRLVEDWRRRYAVAPVLMETLVDPARFSGTCYRAANWICLGCTAGRGRMDRRKERLGAAPKLVLVYPLVRDAAARLRESS